MPRILMTALAAACVLCAPAAAAVPHTVVAGETLWSIAAASNFTTRSLAAFNGLSEDSQVVLGATIQIPSEAEAAGSLASAAPAATTSAAAPPPMGAYTVRPGDTLSGLAASSGVDAGAIAAMNGLSPDAFLIAGTAIKLPTGAPLAGNASSTPTTVPTASPAPAPGVVSAADIHAVAARNGVPGSLAAAIGWQESGFNNAMVSSANARGVMQVMPGTWEWVQANLARRQLDPNSAIDNVGAGVLYLGHLLQEFGGDQALAAASYYQGASSVRSIGMLPETQRYVANVMALQSRFGP
ncbi:MAG: LysM peptidoglycan-binding domain-containing protein [Solirubrobacteraceae bacterium]